MKTDSITYSLLKTYAATRHTFTVAGTIRQLTDWYACDYGIRVPERTFQRHAQTLRDAGLIHIRHTRNGSRYTLLSFEFEMPKGRQVTSLCPTSLPGRTVIKDDGAETVRYPHVPPSLHPDNPMATHGEAMKSLEDFDLDGLQASWELANAA